MRASSRLQSGAFAKLGENPREGATSAAAERILMLNAAAARQWLVRVIADRAVQLFRERRGSAESPAPFTDGGSNGHDPRLKRKRRKVS